MRKDRRKAFIDLNSYTPFIFVGICVCVCVCPHKLTQIQLFTTPWTVACQASPSMGSPRQEHCSEL